MEKIAFIGLILSLVGVIVCVTMMCAGLWYGFSGEPWVNGFVACAVVFAASTCIICKDIEG